MLFFCAQTQPSRKEHKNKKKQNIKGTENNNQVNWEDWFIPATSDSKFLISPHCNACEESSPIQWQETKTAYYATGVMFGW